jgi:hypothetical protein
MGNFVMGDLQFLPGDFRLAPDGGVHPPAATVLGAFLNSRRRFSA